MNYGFKNSDNIYGEDITGARLDKLPSGTYKLFEVKNNIYYEKFNLTHDKIIDLPSKEYDTVMKEFNTFLTPSCRARFEELGYIYKRSTLLHGLPGTGKTCLLSRVASQVLKNYGIILFNPEPTLLKRVFEYLNKTQPETLIMVIFEELDVLIRDYESDLLNLLDGEIQRNNVVYLATTNFIKKIPTRLKRPGRFSTVLEVHYPSEEARLHYLNIKLPNKDNSFLAKSTNGLSIDELKEVIVSTECLYLPLTDVISRIRASKPSELERVEDEQPYVWGEDSDDDYSDRTLPKGI